MNDQKMIEVLRRIVENADSLEEAKQLALDELNRHTLSPGLCICRDPNCKIPYGTCHCGCGKKTKIARQTVTADGRIRGLPQKYLSHHTGQTKDRPEVRVGIIEGKEAALYPLGGGNWTLIDNEDVEKVSIALWYRSTQGYAVSGSVLVGATATTKQRLHRYLIKAMSGNDVDHINGNPLDNRKSNLRICSHAENQRNMKARDERYGRYPGVTWTKRRRKWKSDISIGGKHICLGEFNSYTAAVAIRQLAEVEHHGQFAHSLSRRRRGNYGEFEGFFQREIGSISDRPKENRDPREF